MSTNAIIKFDHVTKRFSKNTHKTFKEFFPALLKGENTVDSFTALNDINFEVTKGEVLGIIGPNGSGKSTILKLIANVMSPTTGTIMVDGRVSPLIELGAGMHPELTGRENIFLNGAILGLQQAEIKKLFQSIVDFSELSEFIDEPVKHFSSGMYMRLGFSIAVHVNPEILLIDEILAVGDTAFQAKCFTKMEEFKNSSHATIIFVSHDLPQVEKFCSRCLLLDHSHLLADGKPKDICALYSK
jgi:ABC-type polysaccharide/polyol phosphate transport system ATPase subunit